MRGFLVGLLWVGMGAARVWGETPDRWMEVRSPNFVVLTDANEKQGRKIASQFERMRAVFHTVLPNATGDGAPIIVLALRDKKGFQALEPAAYLAKGQIELAGLFMRQPDKNYILLRLDAEGEHPFATVYHEYTHLTMSKATWMPLWLNEGLAEFFQNTDIRDKDVLVGQASAYDIFYLRDHALLPLTTLLAVDYQSPYYHEEQKGSMFYAESWALTHFIEITDAEKNTHRLRDYANYLVQHEDPVTAAQHAFGDLNQLQKALNAYVGQMTFRAFKVNAAFPVDEAAFQARAVPKLEVDAVRADVLVDNQRTKEGQALLEAVLREDPKNAAAHETMGWLKFREGDVEAAKTWYGEAVQLDSHSYLAHYYYAAMSLQAGERDHDEALEASLRTAIALNGKFAPAYDSLAMFYASRHEKLGEAHLLNAKAVQLEPENLSYRINTASVLEESDLFPGAIGVLKTASKLAKTPEERALVQSLLDHAQQFVAAQERALANHAVVPVAGPDTGTRVTTSQTVTGAPESLERAGKTVVFKKVDGTMVGTTEEAAKYPAGEATGPRHTVERVLRNVGCSYPSVLVVDVERAGGAVHLYSNDFYKIAFTVAELGMDNDIKPCTNIEGKKARVAYAEVSDARVAEQIVVVELRK